MMKIISQKDLPLVATNPAALGITKSGIMIIGPKGVGKTTAVNQKIVADWGTKKGHKMIQQELTKGTYPYLTRESLSRYWVFVDEVGANGLVTNNSYGTVSNPFTELVTMRYELFKKEDDEIWGLDSKANYFTSNCTPSEIEQLFGDHIWSRLQEMCDILIVDEDGAIDYRTGNSLRNGIDSTILY
jgi:hypothetical protein